nr:hypothetical protein GCM10017611_03280 [Rhodococcus wratislaviensis]
MRLSPPGPRTPSSPDGFGQRPVIFNDLPDHVGRFLVLSEFTFCGEQFEAEVVAVQK